MTKPEPTPEHLWLLKLVGDWEIETEASMGPGQPPQKMFSTETARAVGDTWVMCEGSMDAPGGGKATNIFTFGYDPQKKRFVGTFISSMMTFLWLYDGGLDAAGKVLTLDAEGPSFTDPAKMSKYQDIIEIKDDDHRVLSSQVLGDDGEWHRFMTAQYRRVKK